LKFLFADEDGSKEKKESRALIGTQNGDIWDCLLSCTSEGMQVMECHVSHHFDVTIQKFLPIGDDQCVTSFFLSLLIFSSFL
jgi:hypothetical protein